MIGGYPTQREANVPPPRQAARAGRTDAPRRTSSRSKRDGILATATAYFGEHGYEDSKRADVAKAVAIGSTALYRYYVSKLYCLHVLMAYALVSFFTDFERVNGSCHVFIDALLGAQPSSFD